MTQSSFVGAQQSRFIFSCVMTPSSPKNICVEDMLKITCLALVFSWLWFSLDLREAQSPPQTLLSQIIVNWCLNPLSIYTV